jgi:glycosyltransferase involved in cell wall biosynthesis
VVYLGRLKFYKSIHVFIRAAKEVLEKVPDAEFVIAGYGEEEWPLRKLAKELKIQDKIRFVGKVSEQEKIKLYQKAWAFVNPSFMEGWGITSIEANACGTPVVASNVPGLRDAVLNPSSGFLVPYGQVDAFAEKITLLLTDTNVRDTMSKKSIEWAKKFDWQKSADEGLKIINEN